MKKITLLTILCLAVLIIVTSCGTLTGQAKRKVTFHTADDVDYATLVIDGVEHRNVRFPYETQIPGRGGATTVVATAANYEPCTVVIGKRFAVGTFIGTAFSWGILGICVDAATGALMKRDKKEYYFNFKKASTDPTIPEGQAKQMVSRENPGATELEKNIIRWYFDSDPRGARIFYRVISSIPSVVKNTNETYLMSTPFEETKSFNILGLTYENSRDVQIEIKVTKRGYEDQIKRYNVRQAIDQQEISGFFELVPKEQ